MLARLMFAGFVVLTLVEIALFIIVGRSVGVLSTLGLVVLSTVVGVLIIRWRGLALLQSIRATVGQRSLPGAAIADTMLVWVGGALLVVPGFLTSVIGLVLLIPLVRTLIYGFVGQRLANGAPTAGASTARTIELDDEHFRPR